ncbi:hypothetical protein LPY66_20540 [Dehalobacter sp. DCM]|nr:hypothetical protein LPY66_20540 [Dehalobacter sp. DCM]
MSFAIKLVALKKSSEACYPLLSPYITAAFNVVRALLDF